MLVDDKRSKHKIDSTETKSDPVLRTSYSVPYIHTDFQSRPSNVSHSIAYQSHRSSIDDFSLVNKFLHNCRTSLHPHNLFNLFKQRYHNEQVVDDK